MFLERCVIRCSLRRDKIGMNKLYTIGDASRVLGMPASTIRFYDKNGLLPHMGRTESGIRMFTEDDLEWVCFIERLKTSGMPLKEIKRYIDLYLEGDSTIEERLAIVLARRDEIDRQLEELKLARDFIEYKCWFYEVAKESGTCDAPKSIPIEELPPDIARIKKKCHINRY